MASLASTLAVSAGLVRWFGDGIPQAARIPIFLGMWLVLFLVLAVVLVIMVMTGSRRALLDSGTYVTGSYRTDDV